MIYLYRKWSERLPAAGATRSAIATGLALIGFAFFPLHAAAPARPAHLRVREHDYGFVDTLAKDPAFWSFNSGAVSKISNQFAAMPSVHCAWALWCACALVPRLKHTWAKVLAVDLPRHDGDRDRGHRQPLLPRRGRRLLRARRRLRGRAHLHPRRRGPGRPSPDRDRAGDCGQSSERRPARCPLEEARVANPIAAEIAITRISDVAPRVEHEVDAHLVGVERARTAPGPRPSDSEQDQLDVDLASVVVHRLCSHDPPIIPAWSVTVPASWAASASASCLATSARTLSRTARSASDICTSRAVTIASRRGGSSGDPRPCARW